MILNGTEIKMTRGDSESLFVSCVDAENNAFDFEAGDTVYLTVKKNINTDVIELQKVITEFDDGGATFTFAPNDTKDMDFGSYVYDIQLTQQDGTITTIVKPSRFILCGEVTYE